MINTNEGFLNNARLLPIGGGKKIYVSSTHTFGTDAVLLADFAHPKKGERSLDIGTGCGIIPFLWLRDNPSAVCRPDFMTGPAVPAQHSSAAGSACECRNKSENAIAKNRDGSILKSEALRDEEGRGHDDFCPSAAGGCVPEDKAADGKLHGISPHSCSNISSAAGRLDAGDEDIPSVGQSAGCAADNGPKSSECGCDDNRYVFGRAMTAGIEIQRDACLLARKTAEYNGFEVDLYHGDIRRWEKYFKPASFGLITCNPPYKRADGGKISPKTGRAVQRHELTLTLADIAKAAAGLLSYGGRLCVCIRCERLFAAAEAFSLEGLAVKKLRLVAKDKDSSPKLALIEAKKGGREGVKVLPALFMYENGHETAEFSEIYSAMRGE